MCKIRDVSELYALADKCARAEEGRKLPGENTGAGGSDNEDAAPAKRSRRRNNRSPRQDQGPSGKLLGFFVSQRGIEANPDKIKAIE